MSEPQIVLREAQQYVGIRAPVTNGIREFADNAFPELFGWVFENRAEPAGPPFLRYHEVDRAGEPLEVEAGVPVKGAPESANGRVRAGALPAGRYLTALH